MKYSNYIGIFAGAVMLAVAFMPWVYISSIQTNVTGFGAVKTIFGKPALMNAFLMIPHVILFLLPFMWAKRINPFIGAITVAWAIRNFLLLSTCRNGECPQKQIWLYVYLIAAIVVAVMTVLPDVKVKQK